MRVNGIKPNPPRAALSSAFSSVKEESSPSPVEVEKIILPAELFLQHMAAERQAGNKVKSDKRKRSGHVVVFKDGGKLMLHKSGHMSHKYANGKMVQCSPNGKRITVRLLPLVCNQRSRVF